MQFNKVSVKHFIDRTSMHPEENGAVADRFAKQNALNMVRLP